MPTLPPDWLKIAVLMPIDFAAQIDQRSARVTWIDRGIGLNKVVVRTLANIAPLGADDTGGNRVVETERIADRHDPLANFEPVRVTQSHRGQVRDQLRF